MLLIGRERGVRFSADFTHSLSHERPVKLLYHLESLLGISSKIAMSEINTLSACIHRSYLN